nr:MAG TPA: hypothetical protein [Caudoviricetes sp.]
MRKWRNCSERLELVEMGGNDRTHGSLRSQRAVAS